MDQIRKQTGYDFFYSQGIMENAKPVNINLSKVNIEKALEICFKDQPLMYTIENKIVTIREKEVSFLDKVIARFQTIDVRGRVVDSLGNGLSGASVNVKGGRGSTLTNANGDFQLNHIADDATIVVSYLGYITREVPAKNIATIQLAQSTSKLDEIHVIAYGITSKRLATNNSSGITAKDIETQPINNPLLALAGRTPGVMVTQASGLAGSAVTVEIQGRNSITKGNAPFYVVDGSPYSSNVLPTINDVLGITSSNGAADVGTGNPFSYLNPSDIESIEVLKDADATAIYGSRAANGAILITTKKGKSGSTKVEATIKNGVGQVAHKMKLLNTGQYLMMRKEAYANDGNILPTPTTGTKSSSNYDLTVWDQNQYTDWQEKLIGNTSHYSDTQTSISGGSNQTTFRINGGYHRETTVFPGEFSDVKASVGINVNHQSSNQKFKLQFSANYLKDNNQLTNKDLTNVALTLPPNAPLLYKLDGSLNWERIETNSVAKDSISTWTNPLSSLLSLYQIKANNLISNLDLSYTILKGLTFKTNLGYSSLTTAEYSTAPLIMFKPESRANNSRGAGYSNGLITNWIIEPQLTYNFYIGRGKVDILTGTTFQNKKSDLVQLSGSGYSSDLVLKDIKSASEVRIGDQRILSDYKYSAFFGRINYNFDNRYIVNLTARRDGSSRFGHENQFHNFGAVGAAWLFSSEDFLKDQLSILSFGKLKGSYGTTGNDQIGDYAFLNLYNIVNGDVPYGGFNGLAPDGHSNPYLQWELTKKLQGGIDLGFFNDKILLGINYFRNRSSNELLNYSLPNITGFPSILINFPATVQNTGWEISLSTTNIKQSSFSWHSYFNLTLPKNKLIQFPDLETSTYANILVVGHAINVQKAYSMNGVNPETGLWEYNSRDGKIINPPSFANDRIAIIDVNPKAFGGFQNTFSYKGFDLDFLFQFVKQKSKDFYLGPNNTIGGVSNEPIQILNRWQKIGDQANYQKFTRNRTITNAGNSDFNYRDASFIRLKNLSLSWTLPDQWITPAKLQHCRVFVQGQNLLTFTNYIGLDPENYSNQSLPPLRVITFGLQVTL